MRALYFFLITTNTRRTIEIRANQLKTKYIAQAWEHLIKLYKDNALDEFTPQPKVQIKHEHVIWQYWGQGATINLPPIVKLCFKSIDAHRGDYSVIRLDDSNLSRYLDLPDFILAKKQNKSLGTAFFSDLIRLALLQTYGGIWADATILLTDTIPPAIANADLFMFQRDNNAKNKRFWIEYNPLYFGWDKGHRVNVLNSFIVSKKSNPIVGACLSLLLYFWKIQAESPHYFFFQILFDVLIKDYYAQRQPFIVDDTLPHLLQTKRYDTFDKSMFDFILQQSPIHKMTYSNSTSSESYFAFLQRQFVS